MSTEHTLRRRPTLRRSIGLGALALLTGGTLAACGDDNPTLEDPAALVVYTGDADKSIGTPSTFATTTIVVSTTYFFPENTLEPTDGS
ncbi:MAG: hypothetical protein R2754_06040 [Microthrixaceae bacterium]